MSLLSSSSIPSTDSMYSSVESTSVSTPKPKDDTSKENKPLPTFSPNSIRMIIIKGIFLLILAVSGNFVAELMSCQTQKLLSENMYMKHGIIILIIYFSLGFASSELNISPTEIFKQSIYIWLFFLMFNKMDIFFTALVVGMLTVMLVCKDYITYYTKQDNKENKETIDTLLRSLDYLFYSITLTTIIGFGIYFKKQHNDYFNTFSYSKFLFGTPKCSSF